MSAEKVSLFENEREANLTSCTEMVEAALIELGHVALDARIIGGKCEYSWRIEKGSAVVDVEVHRGEPLWILRVSAVVMTTTGVADPASLHRHLLELNASEVTGAAFALEGEHVLLVSERSTVDLDQSEARETIGRIRSAADDYDDVLVERFGGTLGAKK